MKEALLYHREGEQIVECDLCAHHCRINPGKSGLCGVRYNREGCLFSKTYGELIAAHIDPIEKKPLFHYLPGTRSFSIASPGCNFRCSFCQNWSISQSEGSVRRSSGRKTLPEDIVDSAVLGGCRSISYTYSEPTVFFEYAYDTASLAHEKGLGNVFVTNGFMTESALDKIQPYLDACNVDLKSFRDDFYREMCGARLQPVLESIRHMKALGILIEVTTLVIPEKNDSDKEFYAAAEFIAGVDPDIPWHISRFHPDYQYLDSYSTPIETLRRAAEAGRSAGLNHIYIGNVPGESESTKCPKCRRIVISRRGFTVTDIRLDGPLCRFCGTPLAGIF